MRLGCMECSVARVVLVIIEESACRLRGRWSKQGAGRGVHEILCNGAEPIPIIGYGR